MSSLDLPPELMAALNTPAPDPATTPEPESESPGKDGGQGVDPSWAGEMSYEERMFRAENSRIAAEPPW
ncbi:hypothetical protein HLB23_28880 [Nocardia uniformis]|uniref:Uncharacterized protein n=1 Tax=Nocardia uniformis TaxID=53432 RepID=A0A849CIM1_9NOCA|nr:hypothetical protein [Nocardia uniformis]NNH73821.1 hypothetical protein [Nocardia uniformis]